VCPAGRPSGRLHDNFRKENQTELKFSTPFSLIDISVEFEDELNRLYHCWVIKETHIIDQTIPEGGYKDFFSKQYYS